MRNTSFIFPNGLRRDILLLLFCTFWVFNGLRAQICVKSDFPSNLQNGLVAFYPFCGNTNDLSGNANNASSNGAFLTSDRFTNANSAYAFNGTSSFMELPYSSALASLTNDFTFAFWIKNELPSGHGAAHIIHRTDGTFSIGIGGDDKLGFSRQGQQSIFTSNVALSNNWRASSSVSSINCIVRTV